ncbi:hypothetical protein [Actinomadura geliboluensis]
MGLVIIAGAGLRLGLEREGAGSLAELERLAAELGLPAPVGVADSPDPQEALDVWAVQVGLYHLSGRCGRYGDGHWAHQC